MISNNDLYQYTYFAPFKFEKIVYETGAMYGQSSKDIRI